MKTTKHIAVIAALVGFFLTACACSKEGQKADGPAVPQHEPVTVSRLATSGGMTYLEVDGNPFAVYGAQMRIDVFRNCDKLDWDGIEAYYVKAKELGVNTVELSYPWRFLEPEEGQYDFTAIDRMLSLANKYDLKVELLWFSTNMIGESFSYLVPRYILSVPEKKMRCNWNATFRGLYGYVYALYLNDPWILERETKAVRILFDHIRDWDLNNGEKHPVITCQIHNEPDGMVRWRVADQEFKHADGTAVSKEEIWKMTLESLDAVGKAVKEASYKVATRTNLVHGDGVNPFPEALNASPKDVFALEGIDFVSFDPYRAEVNEIASETSAYASLKGNYPLIAENRGAFPNTPSLMIAAAALGGGYDIYDLATSKFIAADGTPPFDSEGVYTQDLTDKVHTESVRVVLKGLTGASPEIAVTPTTDFAAFNIKTDYPQESISQSISTTGASFGFTTSSSAVGFALDRGDHIVAFATADSELGISGGTVGKVEYGKFSADGKFVPEGTADYAGVLKMQKGVLYNIGFTSAGKRTSDAKTFIGTLYE